MNIQKQIDHDHRFWNNINNICSIQWSDVAHCSLTLTRFVLKKRERRNITREKNLIACLIIMHDWHKIYWNQLVLIGVAAGFETFRSSSLRSHPHSFVVSVVNYVYGRKYEIVYKTVSRKCFFLISSHIHCTDWWWSLVFLRDRLRFSVFFSRTGNSVPWNVSPVTHRLRSTPFSNYHIKLVIWKSRKYFYLEFHSRASYAAWYFIQLMRALIMLL